MRSNHIETWLPLVAITLALPVLAAPPPRTQRVAALVIPMDKASEHSTLELGGYMDEALAEYRGFNLKRLGDLFAVANDDDASASFKRAEQGYDESRAAYEERNYEDAERKLRATIKEYSLAVAAMKECGNLCDAVAMYAAALQARGDAEEAKLALLDLLALAPTMELDRKRFTQNFLALKAQVATSRNAQLRGNYTIKTKPAGARVYLNGEFQGFSPVTMQTLPIGKSLVRVEHPGFRRFGAVVEVTPEDQVLSQDLVATSAYKAYSELMSKLAAETTNSKGGSTMSSVGRSLGLDRAIIAVLNTEDGRTDLALSYFDLESGKRLATKRASFQGNEYGQLKGEVGRMVTHLINTGDGGGDRVSRKGDPLDNRAGTEEWSGEDRGGRSTKKKKKGGDPLDGMSGMEDW